jgi:hypothetical protein
MSKSKSAGSGMSRSISVRLDQDLQSVIAQWLEHNPSMRLSRLVNLALRRFVNEPQQFVSGEKIMQKENRRIQASLKDELINIGHRCANLPDLDKRSPEEILGYDQHGLPR